MILWPAAVPILGRQRPFQNLGSSLNKIGRRVTDSSGTAHKTMSRVGFEGIPLRQGRLQMTLSINLCVETLTIPPPVCLKSSWDSQQYRAQYESYRSSYYTVVEGMRHKMQFNVGVIFFFKNVFESCWIQIYGTHIYRGETFGRVQR